MKKLLSITLILSALAFLSACGDDIPENMPDAVNGTSSKSFPLISAANASQTLEVTFNLNDFTALSEYSKHVKTGSALAASFIEVTGLGTNQAVTMADVSLSLKSDSKKSITLDDIDSNMKQMANTADRLSFMQVIIDEVVRRGSSTVVLKYTPDGDLVNTNSKLTIQLNANFRLR